MRPMTSARDGPDPAGYPAPRRAVLPGRRRDEAGDQARAGSRASVGTELASPIRTGRYPRRPVSLHAPDSGSHPPAATPPPALHEHASFNTVSRAAVPATAPPPRQSSALATRVRRGLVPTPATEPALSLPARKCRRTQVLRPVRRGGPSSASPVAWRGSKTLDGAGARRRFRRGRSNFRAATVSPASNQQRRARKCDERRPPRWGGQAVRRTPGEPASVESGRTMSFQNRPKLRSVLIVR